MVMIVADAILESRGGPRRLYTAEEPVIDEQRERVVDRLQRDRADLGSDAFGHAIRGDVRLTGYHAHDGEPLCGDVDATLAKERRVIALHRVSLNQIWNYSKI